MLTGVYAPTEGTITFDGKSIGGLDPYKVTRDGISRTFQNIRLFKDLSVLDNVKVANHSLSEAQSFIIDFPFTFSLFKVKQKWKRNHLHF